MSRWLHCLHVVRESAEFLGCESLDVPISVAKFGSRYLRLGRESRDESFWSRKSGKAKILSQKIRMCALARFVQVLI